MFSCRHYILLPLTKHITTTQNKRFILGRNFISLTRYSCLSSHLLHPHHHNKKKWPPPNLNLSATENTIERPFSRSHMSSAAGGGGDDLDKKSLANNVGKLQILRDVMKSIWVEKDESDVNLNVKQKIKISLILLTSAKLVNIGVPYLFKQCVDHSNCLQQSSPSTGSDLLISHPNTLLVASSLAIGYGVARASTSLFNELRNAIFSHVTYHSMKHVGSDVFKHLHRLDLQFHLQRQTGALSKIVDRGSRGISTILNALTFNIIPTIFELGLVSFILAYKCGPQFAYVTLGSVATYTIFTLSMTQWRNKFRLQMNKADNNVSAHTVDSLLNYETVKYFNNEHHEVKIHKKIMSNYIDAGLKTSQSLAVLNFGQMAIFSAGLSAMMYLGVGGVATGSLTVGDLVMVNALLFQLSIPLNFLGSVYRELTLSLTDMEVMFALLKKKPAISDVEGGGVMLGRLPSHKTSITFDNIIFEYENGIHDQPNRKILDFVDSPIKRIEIPAGKRVAIVGSSGSGKSTLIRLLYRLQDPQQGGVFLGEADESRRNLKELNLNSWRRNVAVVPQDIVLFNNTIRYNISYGNFAATQGDIEEACQMADIHSSIMSWPNQYETMVGERGLMLSGGEKQRMAIARAILKDSPILIFDEATSSLDSVTEQSVVNALEKATADGRTTMIIAHRLSTLTNFKCDYIYVLDKGRVVECGTHEKLMEGFEVCTEDENTCPTYAHLWHTQQLVTSSSSSSVSDHSDEKFSK